MSTRAKPARQSVPAIQDNASGKRQVVWTLLASAVAGLSTYYYSYTKGTSAVTLPGSYALCADSNKIYTVDPAKPTVDCILVDKVNVLTTGTLAEIQSHWDDYQNELIRKFYGNEPSAKKPLPVFNVPAGSIVVPGLTDAHAHLLEYGFKMQLPLDKVQSLSELLDVVEDYVRKHPASPDTWVTGMGWDQTRWNDTDGTFPTAADLASRPSLASLPIALRRVDAHAVWLSPRALELTKLHLGGTFPDTVPGGEIVRDRQTGEPTGIFVDAAEDIVPVPKWSGKLMREYAARAFKDALAVGLTSVHDAATSLPEFELFKQMNAEGQVPIRIYSMADSVRLSPDDVKNIEIHDLDPASRVRMRTIKLFTDGALGSWGAALLSPYTDKPDVSGIMRLPEEELNQVTRSWWERGWGVNIHAIGDRANKAVLDTFEGIARDAGDKDALFKRRSRIEHSQIMQPEDLERAGNLGIINSVQPTHATGDMWYAESRLGPERIKGAYAYHTLLKASRAGVLPLGSDFPVESNDPLLGFYAVVARLDTKGKSPHGEGGWFPEQRLTRAEALKGMTLDAAYAAFAEHTIGSLSPGKRADFVVLDHDIMDESRPFAEILETKVRSTVVDGKVAYGGI